MTADQCLIPDLTVVVAFPSHNFAKEAISQTRELIIRTKLDACLRYAPCCEEVFSSWHVLAMAPTVVRSIEATLRCGLLSLVSHSMYQAWIFIFTPIYRLSLSIEKSPRTPWLIAFALVRYHPNSCLFSQPQLRRLSPIDTSISSPECLPGCRFVHKGQHATANLPLFVIIHT